MTDVNATGQRGEAILMLALTELVGPGDTPYFRAAHLGEKWPVTDYFCQMEGLCGYSFHIQVKSTRKSPGKSTLPLSTIPKSKIAALSASPVPFYLVGVHEPSKKAYIAVPNSVRSVSSIPTTHLLSDKVTLDILKTEIEKFWNRKKITHFVAAKSKFSF